MKQLRAFGEAHEYSYDLAHALKAVENAIAADPDEIYPYLTKAEILYESHQPCEAERSAQEAINLLEGENSRNGTQSLLEEDRNVALWFAYTLKGKANAALYDYSNAVEAFRRASRFQPDGVNGYAWEYGLEDAGTLLASTIVYGRAGQNSFAQNVALAGQEQPDKSVPVNFPEQKLADSACGATTSAGG